MITRHTFVSVLAAGACCLLFSVSAQAVPEPPNVFPCANSDVTLGGGNATDCYGWSATTGSQDPVAETAAVNAAWPDGWTFLVKDAGPPNPAIFAGLEFTVAADAFTPTDGWTLSWTDPSPAETFSIFIDFAIVLKAAQGTGGYLFEDFEIDMAPDSADGTYSVRVANKQGVFQDLSHLSVLARLGDDPGGGGGGGDPIPEPATILLLGGGLVGLAWYGRRRKSS